MSTTLVTKLDELMELVRGLEANPSEFPPTKIARVLELNNDLFEGYRLVAGNPEAARGIDRRLDHYLRTSEVDVSAFRQVLLQLHATQFVLNCGNLGSTSSYDHAVEIRPRNAKEDGDFFRNLGVLRILDPINTLVPLRLRLELLAAIARWEIEYAAPAIIENEMDDKTLLEIPRAKFILGIIRRWEENGRQNLTHQPNTVENRLLAQRHFHKMADEDPVVRAILGRRGIGYIPKDRFWAVVKRALSRLVDWLSEVFRYVPDALRIQRARMYTLIGLFFLVLAFAFVVYVWQDMKRMNDDLEYRWGRNRWADPSVSTSDSDVPRVRTTQTALLGGFTSWAS